MEAHQFFTVDEVSRMLRVSPGFVRGELRKGRFFPVSGGVAAIADTRTVIRVAGEDRVSLLGLSWYLRAFCAWPCQAAAVAELQRALADVPEVVSMPSPTGVSARSEGELRRKLANG